MTEPESWGEILFSYQQINFQCPHMYSVWYKWEISKL